MAQSTVSIEGLDFALVGVTPDEMQSLLEAERDPARVLPSHAEGDVAVVAHDMSRLPSIEDIEAALVEHVRGGASPIRMIEGLFHPFSSFGHITLEPGKGQSRTSYQLSHEPFDIAIYRAPTRVVAEQLHAIGSALAELAIGERAPDGSQEFHVRPYGWNDAWASIPRIRAANLATAREACRVFTGHSAAEIRVPINLSSEDLVLHVRAAESLIEERILGEQKLRGRALKVIAAVQDLRAVATVLLRRNEEVSNYSRHWIDIPLVQGGRIDVSDERSNLANAHERLAYARRHMEMTTALEQARARHPVLETLPEAWIIRLSGEPSYLDASIVDGSLPQDSYERSIPASLLEYSRVTQLAERLAGARPAPSAVDAHWHVELSDYCRSKSSYTVSGVTLAHALATIKDLDDDRLAMTMTDLVIDLLASRDGDEVSIQAYRLLPGY